MSRVSSSSLNLPASLPPHLSQTLATLSTRPNVQSTLILSRQTGNIICATGALLASSQPAESLRTTLEQSAVSPNTALAPDTDEDASNVPEPTTPAQHLARAILSFLDSAQTLGLCLQPLNSDPSSSSHRRTLSFSDDKENRGPDANSAEKLDDDRMDGRGQDLLQLLRLRTTTQEIIIYPDARYVCCVVQGLAGKYGGG